MIRVNARRPSAKLQAILVGWLNSRSSMRHQSRPSQIRAAAKQMQRSGSIPMEVARALGLVKEAA